MVLGNPWGVLTKQQLYRDDQLIRTKLNVSVSVPPLLMEIIDNQNTKSVGKSLVGF